MWPGPRQPPRSTHPDLQHCFEAHLAIRGVLMAELQLWVHSCPLRLPSPLRTDRTRILPPVSFRHLETFLLCSSLVFTGQRGTQELACQSFLPQRAAKRQELENWEERSRLGSEAGARRCKDSQQELARQTGACVRCVGSGTGSVAGGGERRL